VIDHEELRRAFVELASEIQQPYELAGVTFHGPEAHREWVAFLTSNDPDKPMGCEGWGATPIEALQDLRRHMRTEHPEEFGEVAESPQSR
jgi:hypothetical protein